ncbi:AraC family transcriptional regulator [Coraliomargarita sp. SDUM461004]|uniref:AraC family transcriptional regulator n=1 Tax=Thalassobacterium sedimentorum TaxID=3041258 RepID=A0ABU1ALZ8_9BACT|nr:AraC family transcriptional regulator [Coraliomargarita sp. SDUM461004]MDQ8194796.1 AraC family transcriptional regulator [Coraliomargarita sp. SDUM461004]
MVSKLISEPQIELLAASKHGVKVSTFEKERIDSHWHYHHEVELVWIERGEGILHAGDGVFPYKSNQLILLGANMPHAFGSNKNQQHGAKWTVLHFRPSSWGDHFWQLPENNRIQQLLTEAVCGYAYTGETSNSCAGLLQRIEHRKSGDMPLARLLDLLEMLARDKNGHKINAQPASHVNDVKLSDARLRLVLKKLEEVSHEPQITQAEVAQWINMSPQSFCRYFQQLTGRKFQHHLNELRISNACANLLSTEKSVAEIAYASGFNNLSNFNRRFRDLTGQTPRNYRKTLGGLGSN